ncbi:MAG: hypothetical protein ACR2NX_10720 [Chthoniobacterales bacterium]
MKLDGAVAPGGIAKGIGEAVEETAIARSASIGVGKAHGFSSGSLGEAKPELAV